MRSIHYYTGDKGLSIPIEENDYKKKYETMKLSVITVNFNHKEGLKNTINSVICQKDFDDYEFIVIDGGSTDGSKDVIVENSSRISYWVSEKDGGIYNGMNKGIKVAKGEYLIFMNSGDTFYNDHVLADVFYQNCEAEFIVGNHVVDKDVHYSPKVVTCRYMFKTALYHQATFIKASNFKDQLYDERYKIVADWAHMFRRLIVDNASYQYVDVIVCRCEEGGISATHWQDVLRERQDYLKTILPERIYNDYDVFFKEKLFANCPRDVIEGVRQICNGGKTEKLFRKIINLLLRIKDSF